MDLTIGERIRKIRKLAGLTQVEFGKQIGIKQNSLTLIENGKRNTSNAVISLICKTFDVREDWLRSGGGSMYNDEEATFSFDQFARDHGASDLELAVLKAYFDIDPDIRQEVIKQLEKNLIAQRQKAPHRKETNATASNTTADSEKRS